MKKFVYFLCLGSLLGLFGGCSTGVSVGRHHPHGAAVSAQTHGPATGVHAAVY